jgi:ATP-dependent Clp protease protease subunit
MQGDIFIIGQIGSGQDEQTGAFLKGVELVDIIAQFRAIPISKKDIVVVIDSPGGYVDTGDSIYNYLESKKAEGYKITTVQRGIVGSIATKIFLAGDQRIVNDSQEFFIHNPLVQNVSGDANVMKSIASQLEESKQRLMQFYIGKTGNNQAAIEPLMNEETSLTADQAVALGFATKKVSTQKEYATIKKNMDFKKMFEDFKSEIKNMLPAPAPVAAPVKASMELKLADGSTVTSDAADASALRGSSTNAPDGTHALADGSSIVVAGGKITEVKPAQAAPVEDKYVTVAQFQEFATMVKDSLSAVVKPVADLKASVDTELVNIKNQIKGKHTPPTKQFAKQPESDISVKDLINLRTEGKIDQYKIEYKRKFGVDPDL